MLILNPTFRNLELDIHTHTDAKIGKSPAAHEPVAFVGKEEERGGVCEAGRGGSKRRAEKGRGGGRWVVVVVAVDRSGRVVV